MLAIITAVVWVIALVLFVIGLATAPQPTRARLMEYALGVLILVAGLIVLSWWVHF